MADETVTPAELAEAAGALARAGISAPPALVADLAATNRENQALFRALRSALSDEDEPALVFGAAATEGAS
ncbi:MAG: hypothetical protein U0821_10670 [Chloroflexota bacterium]